MVKKRVSRSRKRQLTQPDEFLTFSGRLLEFATKHKAKILWSLSALGVLIIAVAGLRYFLNKAENKAFALLGESVVKYETAIKKNKTPEEAYQEVKKDFRMVLDKYSGQEGGKLARVIYANICYRAGDFDGAILLYNKALHDFEDNPFFKSLILSSLGYSFEGKKDYQNAVKYFEMVGNGSDSIMKDEAFFNLGELYAAMGNSDKSLDSYRKIISDYADSLYIEIVKEKLAEWAPKG